MQIATLTTTGQIVEIVAVRGGWTTIRVNGTESKVRNGKLANHGDSHDEFEGAAVEGDVFEDPAPAPAVEVVRVVESAEVDIDTRKNGSVDPLYLNKYRKTVMNINGKKKTVVDCDDRVAQRLRGLPLHIVYMEAANLLDSSVRALMEQYQHLNPGMQRMNLSNRMRAALRKMAKEAAAMEAAEAGKK